MNLSIKATISSSFFWTRNSLNGYLCVTYITKFKCHLIRNKKIPREIRKCPTNLKIPKNHSTKLPCYDHIEMTFSPQNSGEKLEQIPKQVTVRMSLNRNHN